MTAVASPRKSWQVLGPPGELRELIGGQNEEKIQPKSSQIQITPNQNQAESSPSQSKSSRKQAEIKPNPTKIISESRKPESKGNRSRSSRKSAESRKPKASRKVKPARQSQSVRSCWCSRCSSCTESLPASQRQMLKHGEPDAVSANLPAASAHAPVASRLPRGP